MEYISTSEIAKIWNVSRRRVTTLCREGRVEGAVFAANTFNYGGMPLYNMAKFTAIEKFFCIVPSNIV